MVLNVDPLMYVKNRSLSSFEIPGTISDGIFLQLDIFFFLGDIEILYVCSKTAFWEKEIYM